MALVGYTGVADHWRLNRTRNYETPLQAKSGTVELSAANINDIAALVPIPDGSTPIAVSLSHDNLGVSVTLDLGTTDIDGSNWDAWTTGITGSAAGEGKMYGAQQLAAIPDEQVLAVTVKGAAATGTVTATLIYRPKAG